MKRWWLGTGFLAVLVLTLAACGGSTAGSSTGMGTMPRMGTMPGMGASSSPATSSGSQNSQQPNTVDVTLSDFTISASQTTFKTGTRYHFVAHNTAKDVAHELMLMMPMDGDNMSMDDLDKMALFMVSRDQLTPGTTKTIDYAFTQASGLGQLEFACHVGSHYSLGMHVPIMVTNG